MTASRIRPLRAALGGALLMGAALKPVLAADAAHGATLYVNTNGAPISCANASCHGPAVTANRNKISRGANAPAVITSAIAGNTGGMGFLSQYCDATCAADIAAYIANPATASAPSAAVSPTTLTFAGTNVGSPAAAQTVTVSNSGAGTLTLSSLSLSGAAPSDFTLGGSCASGTALAAGAACNVLVDFAPTAAGSRAATLTIAHNATGGSSAVALSGTGVPVAAPSIAVSTTLLDFGGNVVAVPATPLSVSVSNPGNAALTLSSTTFAGTNPGDFWRSGGTCPATLAAGASCTIDVGFTAGALGSRTATLLISGNAANGNPVITLVGTGQAAPAPSVSLSTTSLAWGSVTLGTTAAQTVTLANVGNAALAISGVAVTGASGFALNSNGCGTSLAAGTSCSLGLAFAPASAAAASATLTISDNAPGSPHSVALSGTGTQAATALPQWTSSAPLSFTALAVGQQSTQQSATLANAGNAPLVVRGVSATGASAADFLLAGTCATGATVAAGASCDVTVTFAPSAAGARTASLQLSTDGGAVLARDLLGQGIVLATKAATVAPTAFDFGLVTTSVASTRVHLSNAGTAPLTVGTMTATGPFTLPAAAAAADCPPVPFTLLPGQGCDRSISFAPVAGVTASGALVIITDATVPALQVALAGSAPATPGATSATGSAPVTANAAAPAAAAAGGGAPQNLGAAGCTLADGPADPMLPILSVSAAVLLLRRSRLAKTS